jgi:uncharacterized protein YrrD
MHPKITATKAVIRSTDVVSAHMGNDETPIAWPALEKGTPVFGSDGEEIGKVGSVIADQQKDIFSGVTVRLGLFEGERFVPAELVDRLTTSGVHLRVGSAQAERQLQRFDA